jgi:hypothetical protein
MARPVELHSKANAEKVRTAWMPQVSLTVGCCRIRVTVLDDQISRGVGFIQIRADVQNSVSFCVLLFSGSPAAAEPGSIGVGRRHSAVLRSGRCERIRGELATAHSLLPGSAGSRSPERQRQGVDAVYKGSSPPRFACGVLIKFDCRHGLGCTADWWRSECAGEAGRSRRPGQWRLQLSRDTVYSESGGPP